MQSWKFIKHFKLSQNGAAVPCGIQLSNHEWLIFFSIRDSNNRSVPYSAVLNMKELDINQVSKIDLSLGEAGFFDEDGMMPTCAKVINGHVFLYYIGWNRASSVPFRNALGLAISHDGGRSFEKYANGPILDRSVYDPCFVASCDVIDSDDKFLMYYLSCMKWDIRDGEKIHSYHIKLAESSDGIHWHRDGKVMIDFKSSLEYAISTPRVLKSDKVYHMWYSYRGSERSSNYEIGLAHSKNLYDWIRNDENFELNSSRETWDKDMICYPFVFQYDDEFFMLYNGNGYGKSGIGLATWEK